MLYFKLPVNGIDVPILALQKNLSEGLNCHWKLGDQDYQCYGRIYKNPMPGGGYRPEAYMGDSEYREVLLDDKYAAQSFFGIGDAIPENPKAIHELIAQVHIIFFVNLGAVATLKASSKNDALSNEEKILAAKANPARADMEVREAVLAILCENLHGFTFQRIITGPNVLTEYQVNKAGGKGSGYKEFDLQPFHTFRIEGTIRYAKPVLNDIY